tara:strand:- start:211 stop:573 length:363 start_codon:yes stop_codon:yes gene_type:complete
MPHIVLDRQINLFDFAVLFKPVFQKSPLIKIHEMYTDTLGTNALFSTVVIDDTHHDFFIQVMTGKDRTTIRLLPATDPEKTDAVKQSLANLCLEIQKLYPDMKVTKSNLWDFLKVPIVNE